MMYKFITESNTQSLHILTVGSDTFSVIKPHRTHTDLSHSALTTHISGSITPPQNLLFDHTSLTDPGPPPQFACC